MTTKYNMWVARDKNGSLWLHKTLPIRVDDLGRSVLHNRLRDFKMCKSWYSYGRIPINDSDIIFSIKWTDEPKEVKIIDL